MVDMDVAMVAMEVMAAVMVDMEVIEVTEDMDMESDLLSLDIIVSINTTAAKVAINCNVS